MSANPKTWTTKTFIVISQAITVLAVVVAVVVSSQARGYNCRQMEKALDAYTTGLVKASAPATPLTPEERENQDARIVILRETYQEPLANCK